MGRLREIGRDIHLVEGGVVPFYGYPYPTRSVVVRLASGRVWVWSPIAYTAALREEIEALGPIAYLVSPNKLHHLFLGDWQKALGEAALYGPAQTVKKRSDLTFAGTLPADTPADWQADFEVVRVAGSLVMEEIAFFHRPSATLILADLSENFSEAFLKKHWSAGQRLMARIIGIVEGQGHAPLDWRLTFLDRRSVRAARDRFLELAPANVVMAHGEWVKGDGRRFIERSMDWA